MRILAIVVVVAGLVGANRSVHAEDVVAYQVDGDADAGAVDARVEALDEAFGKAVSQALHDLLDPEVRQQNKAVLDRELLGRARRWVARFTVTREVLAGERKQLSVSVRVDRDKLRARLAELNIAIRTSGDAPAPKAQAVDQTVDQAVAQSGAQSGAQSVIVLLRVVAPDGVHATYGLAADQDVAGLAALSSVLGRANMVVRRAPASGPSAKAGGDLPVDDDTAEALASAAGADLVAIAGVMLGPPVPLRGVASDGVLITAHVRLLDRKARRVIGQGNAVTAARGTDPGVVGYAIDRAVGGATAGALPRPAEKISQAQAFSGDHTPVGAPGVVLVRLARATPWAMVQSEIKHLLGARGVSRATLRHVSPAGWVIGVATTQSIDRIASIVKKPPASDTAVAVKVIGDLVEITLSGAP